VTREQLSALVAQKVLGWRSSPDRFLLGDRQWISRTQFQPLTRIQDAFRLLNTAAETFSVTRTVEGVVTATVRIGKRCGSASGKLEAVVITLAVARAVGIEMDLSEERQ
jgi:hypothetical protein